MAMSEPDDRFHVCATCGRLKHEDLFTANDCTCDDCNSEGRSEVNWQEANDGDGWVAVGPYTTDTDRTGGDR